MQLFPKMSFYLSCHPNQLTTRFLYVDVFIPFRYFIIIIIIIIILLKFYALFNRVMQLFSKMPFYLSCHPNQLTTRLLYVDISLSFRYFIIIIIVLLYYFII